MDDREREKEVQKREHLVQTFLIISSFLIVYFNKDSLDKIPFHIIFLFVFMLISAIMYSIFLSRSRYSFGIDFCAIIYSTFFIGFMFSIISSIVGSKPGFFNIAGYSAIFTFSLLSPETSEKIDFWIGDYLKRHLSKYIKKRHSKFENILSFFIFLLMILFIWYIV